MESESSSLCRTKFSPAEDDILRSIVQKFGARKWNTIAQYLPGRTARQCRDRFRNYLSPDLKNGPWSREEDIMLIEKVKGPL
ncbi:Myb-like DNA-binding domain containing protein [Trichomonas vaginalis G3]|uniref:Myb-like DNA-binding domain containing protein n=1 Tax=Trichomonas vaginalis (strain ATCC PRA-98 / G3) TaxID=412133 RepID=A2G8H3_TRIV3|nr:RNA polymerase II transcription regulator recruiting protein [Trichomonas vaginalis G3]EAX86547.1 Myb-like DNA-binding domain containing protein [Trichomonas vaginalis G3]KAI5525683.1 RNA polymerase II transcription regulator recruiting protein [Trichomonas vaginalis G3]|eukprot:XP_001299477.1 Myb-like DNA-binding domain containing protein [Trichomonas vaginalis G3]